MHNAHTQRAPRLRQQHRRPVPRCAAPARASLHSPLQHAAASKQPRTLSTVSSFLNLWHKGDISGIQQLLTDDCLILEPLWAVPGSTSVLTGIAEVSWFRRYFCHAKEYAKFDVLNVASTPGNDDEERVYLQFRESNSRTPAVWDVVQRAIRTRLLFPLYQTDEAGVIMFTLRKSDSRIKEIVCLRKPPETEDISGKVLQDDYTAVQQEAAPARYLTLFDRM